MDYFDSLTQKDLIGMVIATKKDLFLCMPSIHKELAVTISNLANSINRDGNKVGIHILVDFDAQTFRQGYGDFQSIEDLVKKKVEVRSLKDNRISFIISDNSGYFLFIESRSLISADKETINAVRIDAVNMVRLKKYFFGAAISMNFEDEITNAIIEESKIFKERNEFLKSQIPAAVNLSNERLTEVAVELEHNPPLNPDYKRIVEFYSNKFQYVKLKFEGANLQHRKIELPSKALPIVDANLKKRLETKLNLFDTAKVDESFSALQNLKNSVANIREEYLTKVKSRDESLLNKLKKAEFQSKIDKLSVSIKEVKSKTLTDIAKQIELTKEQLLSDLTEFFKVNPKALFPDHPHLWQDNSEYIQSAAKAKADEIIYRIRWPEAHTLVEDFNLDVQFSDITFEDLKNTQFINELKESGLIDTADERQLAEFKMGIETK